MPRVLTRRPLLAGAVVAALVAAAVVLALAGRGGAAGTRTAAVPESASAQAPARADVPDDVDSTLAPLPKGRPQVVEPVVGGAGPGEADQTASAADDLSLPKPTGPASSGDTARRGAPGTGGRKLQADTATALENGVALPPLQAPEAVLQVIRAGNQIARTPYKWGGGHGRFKDSGYDCSGSVSFALYSAGLIDGSYTSGSLMRYGKPGKGRWITLYANGGHVFMEVAGIRFDTSGQRVTGSRWQNEFRGTGGFVARHPPGL